jgi:hypothetical protein
MGAAAAYLWQDELRRSHPTMVLATNLNKTLPHSARPTIPGGVAAADSAQALRPTFEGWGPRL